MADLPRPLKRWDAQWLVREIIAARDQRPRALGSDEAIHMVVDKPFVYALRDKVTGLILVAGYVGQPPKGKA
jgi:serine protease inhibitor